MNGENETTKKTSYHAGLPKRTAPTGIKKEQERGISTPQGKPIPAFAGRSNLTLATIRNKEKKRERKESALQHFVSLQKAEQEGESRRSFVKNSIVTSSGGNAREKKKEQRSTQQLAWCRTWKRLGGKNEGGRVARLPVRLQRKTGCENRGGVSESKTEHLCVSGTP